VPPATTARASPSWTSRDEFHPQFDYSAAEDTATDITRSTLGWLRLSTERVIVHHVPGNHLTMLNAPHIAKFGHLLRGYLSSRENYL
jgi:thioesterase domain-containing protein